MKPNKVVVIGAGHAGGTLVALLRQKGFEGNITLIGSETHSPYHRPPLSKSFDSEDVKWLYEPSFYDSQRITTIFGETAVSIDRDRREVHLASESRVGYDFLVLATGAEPRRLNLPGEELEGISVLRSLDDAQQLKSVINDGKSLAIVGGGYIGLEVAAAARERGVDVTVIEREERILARVASPSLSHELTKLHEERGTSVIAGAQTVGYQCDMGRVGGVRLADGRVIPCEAVLVGAGAIPRDDLAREAGLACDNGVIVDSQTQTSDPSILAIGDVANGPVDGVSTPMSRMRVESIPSAVEQARQAAEIITGLEPAKAEIPWFWSDQFDLKIKIAGIVHGEFETVSRGDAATGSFALYHLRNDRLIAAETVNSPKDFMVAKRLLASQASVNSQQLLDPATDLRSLISA